MVREEFLSITSIILKDLFTHCDPILPLDITISTNLHLHYTMILPKKVLTFVANCAKIFFFMSALFKFLNYLSLFNACNMAFQIKMNFFYQGILCANVNFMLSLFLFSFSLCYYKITLLDFIIQSRSVLQFSTLYIVCTNSWSNKIS